MRPTEAGQRLAAAAARERMPASRIYDATQLATEAGVSPDTVRDFLNGERWPRPGTLSKLEIALGMLTGELTALATEDSAFMERNAAQTASAKTLDQASDVELLMTLLSRATARLGESD